jgi:type VI secretion system protein ImpK
VRAFLDDFERDAKRIDADTDDVYAAKYAFCAAVDETILASQFAVRQEWERLPLQLAFFGDQLAGENFFTQLETLRERGAARVQALEVFYLCLLLGFKGKYLLDGPEKLNYLIARVGDEIVHHKGKRTPFAPHWKLPDQVRHTLKSEVPLWAIVSAFALAGLLAYLGMQRYLGRETEGVLAAYNNVVQLAPRAAHLTITLP